MGGLCVLVLTHALPLQPPPSRSFGILFDLLNSSKLLDWRGSRSSHGAEGARAVRRRRRRRRLRPGGYWAPTALQRSRPASWLSRYVWKLGSFWSTRTGRPCSQFVASPRANHCRDYPTPHTHPHPHRAGGPKPNGMFYSILAYQLLEFVHGEVGVCTLHWFTP
jgi:hypothetical protein